MPTGTGGRRSSRASRTESRHVILGVAGALVGLVVALYLGAGYLNMTAFEMGAAAIVYGWLLLFIRTVSAAAEGTQERIRRTATG